MRRAFFIALLLVLGADRFYVQNVRFIDIGPAWVNTSMVTSIRVSNSPGQEGKTEIELMGGTRYYTDLPQQQVIEQMVSNE